VDQGHHAVNQGNDKPWTLEPTPIPISRPRCTSRSRSTVAHRATDVACARVDVHPDAFEERKKEIHDELVPKLNDIASDRVTNMERKIDDQMKEGNFLKAFKDFINDFCTFPTAFLKGPVVRMRNVIEWGETGPQVQRKLVKEFERVAPFDMYPAPDAVSTNDGPLLQRHRLFPTNLESLRGVEGYKDDAIADVLKRFGESGFRVNRAYDTERDALEGRPMTAVANRNTIEALQFWGPVRGEVLKRWAGADSAKLKFDSLDDATFYEIEAWLVADVVIKAVINPDPMGRSARTTWRRGTKCPDRFGACRRRRSWKTSSA
jgi:hypothetical protein